MLDTKIEVIIFYYLAFKYRNVLIYISKIISAIVRQTKSKCRNINIKFDIQVVGMNM